MIAGFAVEDELGNVCLRNYYSFINIIILYLYFYCNLPIQMSHSDVDSHC